MTNEFIKNLMKSLEVQQKNKKKKPFVIAIGLQKPTLKGSSFIYVKTFEFWKSYKQQFFWSIKDGKFKRMKTHKVPY